jgi:PAS domain S-box-containing protein
LLDSLLSFNKLRQNDFANPKDLSIELMTAKNHVEALLNAIPDLLFEVDREGMVIDCRAGSKELLAAHPCIRVGTKFVDALPTTTAEAWQQSIDQANELGWGTGNTYSVQLPQGERWFELSSSVFSQGSDSESRYLLVVRDVTERMRTEAALQESELRWRFALEGNKEGVWDWDVAKGTVFFSKCWKDMLGYREDEIRNHYEEWSSRVHPDDLPRVLCRVGEHLEGKTEYYQDELRMRCKSGHFIWILCRGLVTSRDADGKPLRMIGTHKNITERKSIEMQLILARSAAESANRAKTEFLANMSHEIRTPLTSILGYANLLTAEGNLSLSHNQRLQAIESIKNAGSHLLSVINDVLDLSKVEAEKMSVEHVDTQVAEIIEEVEGLMQPQAKSKGIELKLLFGRPFPEQIKCDPTRLRQILMNLVGNAIKFTESGSVVITGSQREGNGYSEIMIDVIDTGTGIAPCQVTSLFTPFGQADSSLTRRTSGTGLGLVLSRKLAQLLGGDLLLEYSELGKGSCFRLILPCEPVHGRPIAHSIETSNLGFNWNDTQEPLLQGRILLAEDGYDNQNLIAFVLRKAGAIVETADNGQVALEMLERGCDSGAPFDLLITDIQMPIMDGYTLVRTLRDRDMKLPIIALTAHAMAEDRFKCISGGCNDYAIKPIDLGDLVERCTRWLSESRAAKQSV